MQPGNSKQFWVDAAGQLNSTLCSSGSIFQQYNKDFALNMVQTDAMD
jgi:hypothetical protein